MFCTIALLHFLLSILQDLFKRITSLSYQGDVRMGLAEDSKKVERIVAGSYGRFQDLYLPLLQVLHTLQLAHQQCHMGSWPPLKIPFNAIRVSCVELRSPKHVATITHNHLNTHAVQDHEMQQFGVTADTDGVQQDDSLENRIRLCSQLPSVSSQGEAGGMLPQHWVCCAVTVTLQ